MIINRIKDELKFNYDFIFFKDDFISGRKYGKKISHF